MKKILMIVAIAVLAVACNKNQKAVKQLDGTWNVTSWMDTWDGASEEYIEDGYSMTMLFNNCKLKDDEFCDVVLTEVSGSESDSYAMEYRVAGYGTSLELRDTDYPSELTYLKIEEFTKENLTLVADYGDGDKTTIVLAKKS